MSENTFPGWIHYGMPGLEDPETVKSEHVVTSVRVHTEYGHDRVRIFNRGAGTGDALVFRQGDGVEIARRLGMYIAEDVESPSPIAGKADEMPEWVSIRVPRYRTMVERDPSGQDSVATAVWLADDRERLLDLVEELTRERDAARAVLRALQVADTNASR